jgi:hypothetical protein
VPELFIALSFFSLEPSFQMYSYRDGVSNSLSRFRFESKTSIQSHSSIDKERCPSNITSLTSGQEFNNICYFFRGANPSNRNSLENVTQSSFIFLAFTIHISLDRPGATRLALILSLANSKAIVFVIISIPSFEVA